ncbi:hypothetical protein HPB47_013953 [Ixodes persulcatus]|uniref:Uncharacterized protein n=1 Tax=Ixodes persulcatus TaxID=34615 RepID=A0AC60QXE6_IXOPE|nr:hypothetical protein HPB47_013953 [Ixodes persulcatus]
MAELCCALLVSQRADRVFREHRDAFLLSDDRFVANYRLTKGATRWLCEQLRPDLQPDRTTVRVITVEQQVLCALRFYAAGGFQGTVASDEHLAVHQSTVSRALHAVTTAIVERLANRWIRFPATEEEKTRAKEGYWRVGKISGVVGCVDGTQIAIKGPSENDPRFTKAAYWCRKNYYALNAMIVSTEFLYCARDLASKGVCDADLRILNVDATFPGSVHDSFVWRMSFLREAFLQGHFLREDECRLGSLGGVVALETLNVVVTASGIHGGETALKRASVEGDSGYPLEPWLLNPVPGNPAVGSDEARFNQAHRSTRSVVERCIGMLKNRFRCLQRYRTLHYDPIRSCNIVTACSILHNVCLYINAPEPTPEPEPVAVDELESSDSSDSDSDDPLTGSLHDRGMVVRQRKNGIA